MNRRAFLKGAAGIAAGAATVLFAKDHIEAEKPTAIVGEAQTGFVQANQAAQVLPILSQSGPMTLGSGLVGGENYTIDCSGDTHTATFCDGSVVGYSGITLDEWAASFGENHYSSLDGSPLKTLEVTPFPDGTEAWNIRTITRP